MKIWYGIIPFSSAVSRFVYCPPSLEFASDRATPWADSALPSVSVILIMDSDNEEQLFSAMKCGASAINCYLPADR